MLRKDKSSFIGELDAALVRDANGQPKSFIATVRDVTDQKHTENIFRESENFLASIFESIQDGISVIDIDFTIRRVNNVMKRWYNGELPLEGKKCYQAYHRRSEPCASCPTTRCLKSRKMEMDVVQGFTGSNVEWLELFSYPIIEENTGEITGVVEFARDITERRRMEVALEESAERFRKLSAAAEEGIAIHDRGVIVDANEALGRMFGYRLSDLIGMNAKKLATPETWKTILKHIATGYDKPYEGIGVKKNGEKIYCQLVGKPYKYQGKVLRVAAFRDITELKKAEEELEKYRERLEELVEERTSELRSANIQLKEEIRERKKTQSALADSERELRRQKAELEQKNIALREIIAQIEIEKERIKNDVEIYIRLVVSPLLENLKRDEASSRMVNLLRYHLERLTSPYGSKITKESHKLTPREIEICSMVRGGLTSKDISNILNISHQTVVKHRKNIRQKLGISNKEINLVSYLREI